jgi:hypothetical protein
LSEDTIPDYDQDQANGINGDAWFGSVRTATEDGSWGAWSISSKRFSALYPKYFRTMALKMLLVGFL